MRTQIIAELASNHGGRLDLAHDMIKAAADAGADWIKLQLYNAATLRDDDPQKAWLTQSQVDRPFLESCMNVAAVADVQLTASVFGVPETEMAARMGLTTIKIGSGNALDWRLLLACSAFSHVWLSRGLDPRPISKEAIHYTQSLRHVVYFRGVSQYPTPYMRGLARLMRLTPTAKAVPWGWSDHGADLEVAKEAMLHGATYVERHFSHGKEARWQAWDTDVEGMKELRRHAEACAWEGTSEHAAACAAFLGRWGSE